MVRSCICSKNGVVVASRVDGGGIPNYRFFVGYRILLDTDCRKENRLSCRFNLKKIYVKMYISDISI